MVCQGCGSGSPATQQLLQLTGSPALPQTGEALQPAAEHPDGTVWRSPALLTLARAVQEPVACLPAPGLRRWQSSRVQLQEDA
jgi:hypothetical protein